MKNPRLKITGYDKVLAIGLSDEQLNEALYAFYVLTDASKTKKEKLEIVDHIDPLYEEGFFTKKLVITKRGIRFYQELLKEMKYRKAQKKNG